MITIWSPRWHDRTVLIAEFKCPRDKDFDIEIQKSQAVAGIYTVTNEVFLTSPREMMKTKNGNMLKMVVVPLDKLKRKE